MAERKKAIPELQIKKLHEDAKVPEFKTEGAACLDLHTISDCILEPTTVTTRAYRLRTGLAFEIPVGYCVKIYLRSGIGDKTKLRLANGTGIIDSDYRGEVMLLVENVGKDLVRVDMGDRIAQMEFCKLQEFTIRVVDELSETERGEGGMGSTGDN